MSGDIGNFVKYQVPDSVGTGGEVDHTYSLNEMALRADDPAGRYVVDNKRPGIGAVVEDIEDPGHSAYRL